MSEAMTPNRGWWGEARIPVGQRRQWRIGPLRLRVAHLAGEWRVHHSAGPDPLENSLRLAEPVEDDETDAVPEEILRFAYSGTGSAIALRPALPDRPIVSHPVDPFFVLPGDDVRLFVGIPLWLELRVDSSRELCEIPLLRPSDTWMGLTTGQGEAAYSSQTSCRLRLEDLPFRPHRAVTVVQVRNRAAEPLRLQRISVPVPHLSLFSSDEGRLWTEAITVTREADERQVEFRIDQVPPEAKAGGALTAPRAPIGNNRLKRAFEAFF